MKERIISRKSNKLKFIAFVLVLVIGIISFFVILGLNYKIFFMNPNVKEKEVKTLKTYQNFEVHGIKFSTSNKYVAVAGGDVHLFDVYGNKLWTKSDLHTNFILFIDNDKNIIITSYDKSDIWNEYIVKLDINGNLLWRFESGFISYDSLKISENNQYIAIGSTDKETGKKGFLILLDNEGNAIWTKEFSSRVETLDISKNGNYIIVGIRDGTFYLLNNHGEVLWQKKSYDDFSLNKVRISPEGEFVTFGMEKKYIICLDINGNELWKVETGQISNISISNDSKFIIAGTHWGELFSIDNKGETKWKKEGYMEIEALDISAKSKYIIVGTKGKYFFSNNYIVVYDVHGNLLWKYEVYDTVLAISISSDGAYASAGTRYSKLFFFDNLKAIEDYSKNKEKNETGYSIYLPIILLSILALKFLSRRNL